MPLLHNGHTLRKRSKHINNVLLETILRRVKYISGMADDCLRVAVFFFISQLRVEGLNRGTRGRTITINPGADSPHMTQRKEACKAYQREREISRTCGANKFRFKEKHSPKTGQNKLVS